VPKALAAVGLVLISYPIKYPLFSSCRSNSFMTSCPANLKHKNSVLITTDNQVIVFCHPCIEVRCSFISDIDRLLLLLIFLEISLPLKK